MKLNNSVIKKLEKKALDLRQKTFLKFIEIGEAHLGGSFSMIEIIISLYEKLLKKNDIFVLSKAHSSIPMAFNAQLVVLVMDCQYQLAWL